MPQRHLIFFKALLFLISRRRLFIIDSIVPHSIDNYQAGLKRGRRCFVCGWCGGWSWSLKREIKYSFRILLTKLLVMMPFSITITRILQPTIRCDTVCYKNEINFFKAAPIWLFKIQHYSALHNLIFIIANKKIISSVTDYFFIVCCFEDQFVVDVVAGSRQSWWCHRLQTIRRKKLWQRFASLRSVWDFIMFPVTGFFFFLFLQRRYVVFRFIWKSGMVNWSRRYSMEISCFSNFLNHTAYRIISNFRIS